MKESAFDSRESSDSVGYPDGTSPVFLLQGIGLLKGGERKWSSGSTMWYCGGMAGAISSVSSAVTVGCAGGIRQSTDDETQSPKERR